VLWGDEPRVIGARSANVTPEREVDPEAVSRRWLGSASPSPRQHSHQRWSKSSAFPLDPVGPAVRKRFTRRSPGLSSVLSHLRGRRRHYRIGEFLPPHGIRRERLLRLEHLLGDAHLLGRDQPRYVTPLLRREFDLLVFEPGCERRGGSCAPSAG